MENTNVNLTQSEDYGRHTDEHVSFRGQPIPEVFPKANFKEADSKQVIDKIVSMSDQERKSVTIESTHFENNRLANVKLSTGDIIPVETAIGLAESHMLNGYTTGATMRGGRTLRSVPDPKNKGVQGIYELPRF